MEGSKELNNGDQIIYSTIEGTSTQQGYTIYDFGQLVGDQILWDRDKNSTTQTISDERGTQTKTDIFGTEFTENVYFIVTTLWASLLLKSAV